MVNIMLSPCFWNIFFKCSLSEERSFRQTTQDSFQTCFMKEKVRISVHELNLSRMWLMQQEGKSLKSSNKAGLKLMFECPSQSPDLNPIQMFWKDLNMSWVIFFCRNIESSQTFKHQCINSSTYFNPVKLLVQVQVQVFPVLFFASTQTCVVCSI